MHEMVFLSESLFAYIDGGTGSLLLQAAIAGVLTSLFFLKNQWIAIKDRLTRRPKTDK